MQFKSTTHFIERWFIFRWNFTHFTKLAPRRLSPRRFILLPLQECCRFVQVDNSKVTWSSTFDKAWPLKISTPCSKISLCNASTFTPRLGNAWSKWKLKLKKLVTSTEWASNQLECSKDEKLKSPLQIFPWTAKRHQPYLLFSHITATNSINQSLRRKNTVTISAGANS